MTNNEIMRKICINSMTEPRLERGADGKWAVFQFSKYINGRSEEVLVSEREWHKRADTLQKQADELNTVSVKFGPAARNYGVVHGNQLH